MKNNQKQYIGTFKVVKIFPQSGRREVIRRDIGKEQAMRIVNSYPNRSKSIVVFVKQFYADKYFI
jgi:hypothetical protein